MPAIGITGHVHVPDEAIAWIAAALTAQLKDCTSSGWYGLTCLAQGTDQLFANIILALGGRYKAVLPARDYSQQMIREGNGERFTALVAAADDVVTMPYRTSSREAYLAASLAILGQCDLLLAVWDGKPPRQTGDTAHVVQHARALSLPVAVVWPPAGSFASNVPPGAMLA